MVVPKNLAPDIWTRTGEWITGVFHRVPPYVLDGIAAVMVTAYGLYFLRLAVLAGSA